MLKSPYALAAILLTSNVVGCGDDGAGGTGATGGGSPSAGGEGGGPTTTVGGGGAGGMSDTGGAGGACDAGEPLSSIVADFTIQANGDSFQITECNNQGCGDVDRVSRVTDTDDGDDFVMIVCYGDAGSVSLAYRARTGTWTSYDMAQADLGLLAAVVTFEPYVPFTTPVSIDLDLTAWDAGTNTTAGTIEADYGNGISIFGSWSGGLADCRGDADPMCGKIQ